MRSPAEIRTETETRAGSWVVEPTDYIYSKPEEKTKSAGPIAPARSVSGYFMVRLSSAPGFQSLPLALVRTAPRKSRSLGSFFASR